MDLQVGYCRQYAGLQMIDAGLMLVCCRVNAGWDVANDTGITQSQFA